MGRRLSLVFSFAALVVVTAFPTSSPAATASATLFDFGIRLFVYQADVGEANQVEANTELHTVTVHDSGAIVVAEAGCVSIDQHTAECPDVSEAVFMLGDLDDTLSLTQGIAVLSAVVHGDAGADALLSCAECSALLRGGSGADHLTGQRLEGGSGADALSGSDRTDDLRGGPGNDTITAEGGPDIIFPGGGDDAVDAGAGDDGLFYYNVPGPVTVNLRTGIATGSGTDTITGVEGVTGSDRGDLLIGDEKPNGFGGLDGPDVIRGGAGADRLNGGAQTRHGADRLYGGPGNDVLTGENGDDLLVGGLGWDSLLAGTGNDVLKGEEGKDVLVGGLGWDQLFAGPGDDVLRARDGRRDRVRGQRGHDRARVDRGLDSVLGVEELF